MPRYIDADKLLARYKERCAGCKETKNYCEHCCDLSDVIDDIEDEPTVDLVERKKGKWIHNGSQWKNRFLCSNCNYLWYFPAEEAHYCPNCGSQNEKENENEKA